MGVRPDVSVVVPVHNGDRFLEEAVDSALGQRGVRVEVIVVDDASTDRTREIIEGYGSRIAALHVPKQATAIAATNLGVQQALADFISVLHHDDFLLPDKLSRHVALMRAHPEVAFSYSAQHFVDESGRTLGTMRSPLRPDSYVVPGQQELASLALHNYVSFCNAVVRKDALEDLGLFPASAQIVGEWLTWVRLAKQHHVGYVAEPLVCYRLHADQLTYKRSPATFRDQLQMVHEEAFGDSAGALDDRRLRRLALGNIFLNVAFVHAFRREPWKALTTTARAAARIRPWEALAFFRATALPLRLRIAVTRLLRHT